MSKKKEYIDLTTNEIRAAKKKLLENKSKANNTLLSYKKDFKDFEKFCENKNVNPYGKDYEIITDYLMYLGLRQRKVSTIKRRLSSISFMYEQKGVDFKRTHTKIKEVMKELKNEYGESVEQVEPLEPEDLDLIIDIIDKEINENVRKLINYRDKAILSFLLYGGFRRSEVSNLDIGDIKFNKKEQCLKIKLKKSKADQTGKNLPTNIHKNVENEFIPYCPVRIYNKWIEVSNIKEGKVFRHIDTSNTILPHNSISDKAIALIVKKWSKKAGFDDKMLSGHSGRAGIITALKRANASNEEIKKITKHKSDSVIESYDRRAKEGENITHKYLKR